MIGFENEFLVIEWDEIKNLSNQRKHKISFQLAQFAFFDDYNATKPDFVVDGEQRWKTLGKIEGDIILFIGHLYYDNDDSKQVFRIITARKATPHEEKDYYDNY